MPRHTLGLFLLSLILLLPLPAGAGDGTAEAPLIVGIVPARSPERILTDFGPFVETMERELGVVARIRGAPDYEAFIRRVLAGDTYDMILTGGDTVQFIREMGLYRPLVQMDGPGVFAVIAVRADSPFGELADLRGNARLATADLLAYSTGLGFRRLEAAGLDPRTDLDIVYVPSQSAALAALLRGQVDASIIMVPIVRAATPEMRDSIRIIAETERAPPPAFSLSTSLDPDLADRILQFLLDYEQTDEGSAVLQGMGWPGLIPVRLNDYDALEWAAQSMSERLKALEN